MIKQGEIHATPSYGGTQTAESHDKVEAGNDNFISETRDTK